MIILNDSSVLTFIIYTIISSVCSFFIVYFFMPRAIKSLTSKGKVVQDYHKPQKPNIPRPAGPILIMGIIIPMIIIYLFTFSMEILAILFTTIIAFCVGYIDDKKVMPGWFKPVALIVSALPIIILGVYDTNLNLIFGDAFIPILYIQLIISVYIFGSIEVFVSAVSLFFINLAFYKYHKFPSKIFPGDSGTLMLGAMYGAIAIIGKSELIAIIALLPAIFNSFLFLSSVKRVVEHREITTRPTFLTDDFKLDASKDKKAPITLLRLILVDGPLTEKELATKIFKLGIFSSCLALISIVIQYYFVIGISG